MLWNCYRYIYVYFVCMQCINRHIIIRVCLVKYIEALLHVHSQCVMTTRMAYSNLYVFNKKESIKDFLKEFNFKCLANNICDNMEWKKVLYYIS